MRVKLIKGKVRNKVLRVTEDVSTNPSSNGAGRKPPDPGSTFDMGNVLRILCQSNVVWNQTSVLWSLSMLNASTLGEECLPFFCRLTTVSSWAAHMSHSCWQKAPHPSKLSVLPLPLQST